ncbi:hypothetical protein ABZP36_034821 [Zizania latifolia]
MAGVEPPAPPAPAPSAAVAGLAARGVRPRRTSAKRSWPPGCGRFPRPPPPPPLPTPTADDSGIKGVDGVTAQGGADEVDASAKRSWPPGCGRSSASPPPPGDDGERGFDGVPEDKVEMVAPPVFSSATCNGTLPHVAAQADLERMEEEEEGRQTREQQPPNDRNVRTSDGQEGIKVEEGRQTREPQPSNDRNVWPSDGQEGIKVFDVMPLSVAAPLSHGATVSNGSVEDIGDVPDLLLGGKGSGELARKEISSDGGGREMESRVGVGELERNKVDAYDGGRKKRFLMSGLNPPPKRRAILAIRRFPPGCGRAAAPLAGNGGEELPLKAAPISVASSGAYMEDVLAPTPISARGALLDHSSEAINDKRIEDDGSSKVRDMIQEFQDTADVSLDDFDGAKSSSAYQNHITTKLSPRHGFDERVNGKRSPRDKKLVARAIGHGKETRKCEGRLQEGAFVTRMSGLVDVKEKHNIIESDKMIGTLKDNAKSSRDGKNRKKTSSIQKGMVRSNVNMKQDNKLIKESKYEKHAMIDQIEENDDFDRGDRVIVQALMAPSNCPWTQGRKSIASVAQSRTPKHMLKKKNVMPRKALKDATRRKELSSDVASSKVIEHEAIEDKEDSYSEDEGNSKALVVHGRKIELCVTLPPCGPSGTDARSKVRKLLRRFQAVSRKLMQLDEQHKCNISRIDIAAVNIVKQSDDYTKLGPIVGNVHGVEVGDEFHFRVELSIVGLHRPYQGGIDTSKVNGTLIAISIVASGGYPDELSSSDELIYTGSGGKAIGKKASEDQKLQRGNLALKNCIETKTPVRVIHGFKGQSRGEAGHSKPKQISTYIYDGLYTVMHCWQEGPKGSMVFKYKLQRNAGQPKLALHTVKETRKSKVREGLCLPDISHGNEGIPVCVVNTVDDMQPAPFKYTTKVIYPHSYAKEPPKGCDCLNGCSDSNRCACAVKNGGEIPFNFNGAIVQAKALVYECGPSCRCPPTCHNRVSQHGIKIPLEIFKTANRGWGVRSLSSISSGSFICEYTGELLQNTEAEQTENDEYLFDIGHNYHVKELWEGLPSDIPGLESSAPETMNDDDTAGFTIDAAKCGNVGRFINHSCSPNLYAQNVLWDHDDKKVPHIAFFACENIPPLQELTYHYNYTEVKDNNGKEKVKHCFCGSSDCCGRLY